MCAGLGKTTLAHVVARHCGYRTVEINASDERTAATLQARISDAVQMQSVMGAGRPNCVIIDEIDGATGEAPSPGTCTPSQMPLLDQGAHVCMALGDPASSNKFRCLEAPGNGTYQDLVTLGNPWAAAWCSLFIQQLNDGFCCM